MPRPMYMDNNATTRTDPRVVEAMLPYFTEEYGNASSVDHSYGRRAADAVETARKQVAKLIACEPSEVLFTSGATEANNIALKGVMCAAGQGGHLIVNAAEHKAILDPAKRLKREGYEATVLPVDEYGRVDPQSVATAIRPETKLVSVMLANNEVGTLNPIAEIGHVCRDAGVLFHTDATQAVGHLPVDLRALPADLLSFSAHKMYGPKGIGALIVRRDRQRIRITPLVDGGGHERKLRSGTLAVPLIVCLGEACRLCEELMPTERDVVTSLRDELASRLQSAVDGITFNGHPDERLPGNLHISIRGVNNEALIGALQDIVAISSGSACTTTDPDTSHVLLAMGLDEAAIDSSLRIGLGRFNSADEVETVAEAIAKTVRRLRQRK